ncbi:MAG: hypothetical protein AABX82_08855 [Nanoarchaeota archaeon]
MLQTKDWMRVVSQFKTQTLPKTEWTHHAHLVVALWHLLEYKEIYSTLCYLRPDIIIYNHSVGTKNTDSSGYHETTTVFWLKKIKEFIDNESSKDFNTLVEKLLRETPFTQKEYILTFYKKEVLKSSEARCFYIASSF